MLDRQLKWLALDIMGYEDDCEFIISDNCSTDNTQEIVAKWKLALSPRLRFKSYRNAENIGGMANIEACLRKASGKFVWSLGDDDSAQNGTIGYLLSKIKMHPNLSLILLNGFGRDVLINKVIIERFFDSTTDRPITNGARGFQHCLSTCMGGVLFITSAVYHTKLLHKAFFSWPESAINLAAQAYWVAFCAARGSFIITPSLYTECAMGIGFTDKDPKWIFKMIFSEIPDVYLRLMKSGYSRRFCFSMILRNLRTFNSFQILFGAIRRWPIFATRGFIYYVKDIAIATILFSKTNGRTTPLKELATLD